MRLFLQKRDFKIPSYKIYNHKDFGYFFKELHELTRPESLPGPLALDLETSGLDPFLPNSFIRSVSISGSLGRCLALDFKDLPDKAKARFWDWASSYPHGFVMHNAVFDASWCQLHGKKVKVHRCTSVMFRNVSNEGYVGQRWGLKVAMEEILGWSEVNTPLLDKWLHDNKLGKGDMCLAPWSILGPYNALDAGATYQLYSHITGSLISPFETLEDYWDNEIATMIDVIVEQYTHGLYVDMNKLNKSLEELDREVQDRSSQFLSQSTVAPQIVEYNRQFIEAMNVNKHSQFTSKGEENLNWVKHNAKVESLKGLQHFNIDSNEHLKWLFFTQLKKIPVRFVEKKVDGRKVRTDNPSVDKKALPLLGEETRPLIEYRNSRDILKFLTAINNIQVNGVMHPSLTISGTVTGRLSGGLQDDTGQKFNLQNIVNDNRVFDTLIAPPHYKIIYSDFSSLEPHVLTQFSGDPRLRELYLNNSNHDLYLWYGANTSFFGEGIRKIYPLNDPTKELVSQAKKELKDLRKALKIIYLGISYGMGAKKLMEDVNNQTDFTLSLKDATRIIKEYFLFFPGIARFIERLDLLYVKNDEKFILNPRGRPLFSNMEDRRKLMNKFIQSGGHDCLMLYIHFIKELNTELNAGMIPYHVDLHDATMWIYPDNDKSEVLARFIYDEALNRLNETLDWEVKLKAEIKIGNNLGDFQ